MIKKSTITATGALVAFLAIPLAAEAQAQDFDGPYAGVEAGIGIAKVKGSTFVGPINESDTSALFGGILGYRAPLGEDGRLVLGVEGNLGYYTNGSSERYGVSGIGGLRVGESGLAYLRVGYNWLGGVQTGLGTGVDGLVLGGGYEFGLSERMNLRLDYKYLDYGSVDIVDNMLDFSGHEITAGVLFNF